MDGEQLAGGSESEEGMQTQQAEGSERGETGEAVIEPLQESRDTAEAKVLSDLLREVPPLKSEDPREIMSFCMRVKVIYNLHLVTNKIFWTKLLPRVQSSLVSLLGQALQQGESWEQCMGRVLGEYFPLFVKEKLIRDLVVFNFHDKTRPLRQFIAEVAEAAEFLYYAASEAEVVERIMMNLHPEVLDQCALLPRPTSYRDLRNLVGLIEERMAVLGERKRPTIVSSGNSGLNNSRDERQERFKGKPNEVLRKGPNNNNAKCWKCGRKGHMQKDCRSRNARRTIAALTPQARVKRGNKRRVRSSVRSRETGESDPNKMDDGTSMKGGVEPLENSPLWVKVNFKVGSVLSLVDTGAQFSCIRRDVLKELVDKGLKVKTNRCQLSCHVVDGSKCEITEAGMFRCSVGSCTWNFHFKVLEEGPYKLILGLDFLTTAQIVVDVAHREYYFAFAPHERRKFEVEKIGQSGQEPKRRSQLRPSEGGSRQSPKVVAGVKNMSLREEVLRKYSTLFSDQLGTAKGMEYEIDLVDSQPVRSAPYRCSPQT
jgi:hypothetical protein